MHDLHIFSKDQPTALRRYSESVVPDGQPPEMGDEVTLIGEVRAVPVRARERIDSVTCTSELTS